MSRPLLWHFPVSHFNEKARWALDWKRIPHDREVLGPSYVLRAPLSTGQMSLPILFLEGRAVADSTRIIEALERYQPDPPLYPADPEERRRALEIEDFFDEELGHALRSALIGRAFASDPHFGVEILATGMSAGGRAFMHAAGPLFRFVYQRRHAIDEESSREGYEKIDAALDRVEKERAGRDYLVGDAFSVADLTAAALLSPLCQPPEYPASFPDDPPDWFADYLLGLSKHPAMAWVLETYRRHRGRWEGDAS